MNTVHDYFPICDEVWFLAYNKSIIVHELKNKQTILFV